MCEFIHVLPVGLLKNVRILLNHYTFFKIYRLTELPYRRKYTVFITGRTESAMHTGRLTAVVAVEEEHQIEIF